MSKKMLFVAALVVVLVVCVFVAYPELGLHRVAHPVLLFRL